MPERKLSKTSLLLLVFVGTLAAPFLLQGFLGGDRLQSKELASGIGLRIITPHNQEIRRVFAPAFSDWHQEKYGAPVRIKFLSPGGSRDIVRYLTELFDSYRGQTGQLLPEPEVRIGIDMVWGGGDYVFERDYKPFLKPLTVSPEILNAAFPQSDLAGVPLFDPSSGEQSPRWVGVVLSSFGIVYSPEFYETLQLSPPTHWRDLAIPELSGLVALADPTRSGPAALIYMMVVQRGMADAEQEFVAQQALAQRTLAQRRLTGAGYEAALAQGWKRGMRTLLKMAANARYFTDSSRRPCADVGDSQAAVGVSIDFYARVFQEEIGRRRLRYVAPAAETAITPDPIGVLYGTQGQREVLANRFVEFLLSHRGQRLWNLASGQPYVERSLRRLPIVRAVYSSREHWADPQDNPFESAGGFNLRNRWMKQMSVLRPIWAAAWIDTERSLKRAYRAILALPLGRRRQQLLFELSDLPIEMNDLLSPPNDVVASVSEEIVSNKRLAKALSRVGWARRFRAHYREVLQKVQMPVSQDEGRRTE